METGCECTGRCNWHGEGGKYPAKDAPLAYLVMRAGKPIKVCTRCCWSDDTVIGFLVDVKSDKVGPYVNYDPLGFMILNARLMEEMDAKKQADA